MDTGTPSFVPFQYLAGPQSSPDGEKTTVLRASLFPSFHPSNGIFNSAVRWSKIGKAENKTVYLGESTKQAPFQAQTHIWEQMFFCPPYPTASHLQMVPGSSQFEFVGCPWVACYDAQ